MNESIILSGYSYDKTGPYLLIDNIGDQKRYKFYFDNKICSIKWFPDRYCIGGYDLSQLNSYCCPDSRKLEPYYKKTRCERCDAATGFNPAFYNTDKLSPQQKEYNRKPHSVYLAYFAPGKVKVGIASTARLSLRLLEQGARAAAILANYENAYKARDLERFLTVENTIPDHYRSSEKQAFLSEYSYSFQEAKKNIDQVLCAYGLSPASPAKDLTEYYFYHNQYDPSRIYLPDKGERKIIAGRFIGMIGDVVILRQGGITYGLSVKEYIGHGIEMTLDEVQYQYSSPIQQMSLSDFL